jgi:hypothetical protein
MINPFPAAHASRRRLAAIATAGSVTLLSALPFAQPVQAATGFQRAAYFVGADGSLNVFGSNSDGVWSKATPLTPAKSAPAGTPVTAVRGPSGRLLAYYVGSDGAVYESCDAVRGSYAAVTASGFAPAGSPVSATPAGGGVHLTVASAGGFSSADDYDPPTCGNGLHWWGPGPRPKWWTVGGEFATVGYGPWRPASEPTPRRSGRPTACPTSRWRCPATLSRNRGRAPSGLCRPPTARLKSLTSPPPEPCSSPAPSMGSGRCPSSSAAAVSAPLAARSEHDLSAILSTSSCEPSVRRS